MMCFEILRDKFNDKFNFPALAVVLLDGDSTTLS